jgi:hypothetical protein
MKGNSLKYILSPFISAIFLFVIIGSSWALSLPVTIKIDPLQTYLVPDLPSDIPNDSPAIELSLYNINPGDSIRLERLGDFRLETSLGEFDGMTGVFSSSDTILGVTSPPPAPDPNRVDGALDAGEEILTELTSFSLIVTDISEDFLVGGNFTNINGNVWAHDFITITVPFTAQYLFVAAFDNRYLDNTDDDFDDIVGGSSGGGNFAVRISMASEPIPEPATIALLGIGLAGLAGVGVRRKWKKKAIDKG